MGKSRLIALLALLGAAPTAFAGTLYVPSGPYPTIQSAIDAAVAGDTVLIAAKAFYENVDMKGKAITLRGKDRKYSIINGSHGGPCITIASGETAATVITNLTLKFGTGKLIGTKRYGGGIYIANGSDPSLISMNVGFNGLNYADFGAGIFIDVGSDPLIQDCLVANNVTKTGGMGAGMYVAGNPLIIDTRIAENTATNGTGGGVYLADSTTTITSTEIDKNHAYYGGGVHINGGTPTITANLFEENTVNEAPLNGEGAGIAIVGKATPWVADNEFRYNTAHSGAGVYVYDASPAVVNNLIHDNRAATNAWGYAGYGGGMSYGKGGGSVELNEIYANGAAYGGGVSTRGNTATAFVSNVVDHNDVGTGVGGGIYSKESSALILGNTIALNNASDGGGLYAEGSTAPLVDTTIIFFNTAPVNKSYYDGTGIMLIQFSDVEDSSIGGSSLDVDPVFANPGARDFRLQATSPVIDAGSFTFGGGPEDVYHSARISGGRVDMGAAEY